MRTRSARRSQAFWRSAICWRPPDLDERERRWVDTIKAGAEHLASLATLFVDAARSGGPGLEVRQDFFDLRTLARNAGDSLTGRAAAKGLQSSVVISEKLPAFAIGDPVRLRAAVENLIDNAVKFTEQGSVTLQVTPLRSPKGKVAVAFEVSDSGIGLTLAEIKRLFRPFSQANVSIASRFGGAGLGLSSVKQLARAMGGDVTVTQRRGGGTTFTFNVVMSAAKDAPTAASGADGEVSIGSPRPLRLLSVEDNPFGRVVLNAILTELGHQAEFVGQGEAAPERLAHRRIRCGADGHGAAGDQRHRGDHAHSRASAAARAHSDHRHIRPQRGRGGIARRRRRSLSGQACVSARPCDCAA